VCLSTRLNATDIGGVLGYMQDRDPFGDNVRDTSPGTVVRLNTTYGNTRKPGSLIGYLANPRSYVNLVCKLHDSITPTTLLNYLCKNEVNYLSSLSLLIERTIWLIAIIITIG
jgi:hypothetical protein